MSNDSDIKTGKEKKGWDKIRCDSHVSLLLRGLEDKAILRLDSEGHTELKELDKDIRELLEKDIAVLGIAVDVGLEALVLNESHISGQHHESGSGLVSELSRAVPLLVAPLLLDKETEELVAENSRAEVPRAVEAGAVGVAATQSVSTAQCNHLTVIEAHATKDITDVTGALSGVGQTAIGCTGSNFLVLTTGSPGNGGTAEFLNSTSATESPKIGVGDPGELGLDRLKEVASGLQTGIGAVV